MFISEGALANQDVVKATAVDVDASNNSKIHYEIIAGNEEGKQKSEVHEVSLEYQLCLKLHQCLVTFVVLIDSPTFLSELININDFKDPTVCPKFLRYLTMPGEITFRLFLCKEET